MAHSILPAYGFLHVRVLSLWQSGALDTNTSVHMHTHTSTSTCRYIYPDFLSQLKWIQADRALAEVAAWHEELYVEREYCDQLCRTENTHSAPTILQCPIMGHADATLISFCVCKNCKIISPTHSVSCCSFLQIGRAHV